MANGSYFESINYDSHLTLLLQKSLHVNHVPGISKCILYNTTAVLAFACEPHDEFSPIQKLKFSHYHKQ